MSTEQPPQFKKREDFKKRMMAQGKLPQTESDKEKVINRSVYSPFEAWAHYTKKEK